MNLSVSKVRGQCYDGAATMSCVKSGVVARLCAAEPRAVYTYCYGYSLNLEVANDFIPDHDHRQEVFGTEFKVSDFEF